MYVDSNHLDYKYIVSVSDNYIVLTNTRSVNGTWDRPAEIDTFTQYINPSIFGFESHRTYTSTNVFPEIEVSDGFYSRADCPQLICSIFCCIFFVLFIINGLTKFVKRGGIFFGE